VKTDTTSENEKHIRKLDAEAREIAEIVKRLPEDYRKTLHGTAIGLKLAADLNQPPPPAPPPEKADAGDDAQEPKTA